LSALLQYIVDEEELWEFKSRFKLNGWRNPLEDDRVCFVSNWRTQRKD